jgi:hypothetical protein
MSTASNGIGAHISSRRRSFPISGVALRLLIAFIISWIIILAFFVTGAVSH